MATNKSVLVDTGPLVALLNASDSAHRSCANITHNFPLPLLTTWVVLAEAAWLLRRSKDGTTQLLGLLAAGVIECPHFGQDAPQWMQSCLHRYRDINPQLADVSLLYLAEREGISTILTLDRRDFSVFRSEAGKVYELLPQID